MENRPKYNPFEKLDDFSDLKSLTRHILKSLEVKEVKAKMAWGFKYDVVKYNLHPLPVPEILVGNATFSYIRHRADDVLKNVVQRIEKINRDTSLSLTDKSDIYTETRRDVAHLFQYFNTMNPVRYMSAYDWKIVYNEEENGKTVEKEEGCASSQLDLKDWHWTVLENTLLIRRHLLYEILYLIDVELTKLAEELSNNKYGWMEQGVYEIYELLLALIASKRVDYGKGNEDTFVHDFLAFFGKSDEKYSYSKGKVLDRLTRSQFLPELDEYLEKYGKPVKKTNK